MMGQAEETTRGVRGPQAAPHDLAILTIPGLGCSGPDHWQTLWEARRPGCSRIELPAWDDPAPDAWADAVGAVLTRLSRPVMIAAHSLGCHALVRWATEDRDLTERPIVRAILVAPPDVEAPDTDSRVARFGPLRTAALPFPVTLVASSNDPYSTVEASRRMAARWGAAFVDVGPLGHINAASGLGDWPQGQRLAGLPCAA